VSLLVNQIRQERDRARWSAIRRLIERADANDRGTRVRVLNLSGVSIRRRPNDRIEAPYDHGARLCFSLAGSRWSVSRTFNVPTIIVMNSSCEVELVPMR